MVGIASRRGRGAGGAQRPRRSMVRWIFFAAVNVAVGFYVMSLRFIYSSPRSLLPASSPPANGPPPKESLSGEKPSVEVAVLPDESDEPAAVIAHAVSLIKCSKGSSVTGFLDAAAVLRHSIHKNSIHYRGPNNTTRPKSRYSYKMYGIVHTSCGDHAKVLERLGYEILVRDHPVKREDIKGEWLRNHIEAENCCGSAEFIKLYGEWRLLLSSSAFITFSAVDMICF